MKLGHKLVSFGLLCSVIPLLGMGTLAFDAAQSSLSNIVENDLEAIAEHELNDLQDYLQEAQGHLVTWSRLGIMQDVLVDDSEGDLADELKRLGERYPMFAELLVINGSGQVVVSTNSEINPNDLPGYLQFNAPAPGINFQGQVEHSNRLSKEVITFGIPIHATYSESTIIGSLVGSLDWGQVQANLAGRAIFGGEQGTQRLIVLTSSADNSVLYSTDDQLSNEFLDSISLNSGVVEQQINDASYVVATAHSTEIQTISDPRWSLHVVLDTDIAYQTIWSLLNYMLAIGAVAFLLVTALSIYLARAAVKPINALANGAIGLASGDYNTHLPTYTNNDEIGVLTDSFISMRNAIKTNEQELIKRTEISEQAAKLKGEFLANMSHEVRTPINGVLGMTELLMNTQLDQTQSRYASTISRSGQSLLSVINDILDFSKIEAGKLELQDSAFDLREVVEDVVELVAESAHKKNIEISAHLSPNAHSAYQGDASRVRQILINLLGNAVKFTSVGEVKLSVTSQDSEVDKTSLLRFEVMDTGIGIAPGAQSAIFESFVQADGTTTRKYGGTGLGLAISAQLTELMKGDIGVNSEPGVGSTFWFTAYVGKLPHTVENAWQDSQSLQGKRILIVDDNKTNREILQAQVQYWGAEYFLTEGAAQALRALRTASTENNPFDLAILDMHMPEMDGLALTVAIKDDPTLSETRLILLSSVCDKLDVASYRAIGLESVLTKPVRQPELFRCLTAVMANTRVEPKPPTPIKKLDFSTLCGRVLIAEDNPVNQELITEIMGLMHLDFILVGNGQEALDALSTETFDIILMDCQMPVLDGFEATRKIRQLELTQHSSKPIPIIALTANALQGDRENCLACGMDEYLTKPVSSKQLHQMLSRWLPERTDALVTYNLPAKKPQLTIVPTAPQQKADANTVASLESETTDTAPLDSSAFAEIMAISAQASSGFLARLTQKFIDNSASDIEKLEANAADRQADDIRKLAHSLKSSSANLGAKHLAALCQLLESDSASQNLDSMDEQIAVIKLERDRVIDALNSECQKAA